MKQYTRVLSSLLLLLTISACVKDLPITIVTGEKTNAQYIQLDTTFNKFEIDLDKNGIPEFRIWNNYTHYMTSNHDRATIAPLDPDAFISATEDSLYIQKTIRIAPYNNAADTTEWHLFSYTTTRPSPVFGVVSLVRPVIYPVGIDCSKIQTWNSQPASYYNTDTYYQGYQLLRPHYSWVVYNDFTYTNIQKGKANYMALKYVTPHAIYYAWINITEPFHLKEMACLKVKK